MFAHASRMSLCRKTYHFAETEMLMDINWSEKKSVFFLHDWTQQTAPSSNCRQPFLTILMRKRLAVDCLFSPHVLEDITLRLLSKSLLIKVSLLCSSLSLCGLLQFVAILWSESQFHLLRDLSADPWQTDGQRASGHLLSPVLTLCGQLQWGAGGISHDEESLWNGCHRQIGQDR